MYGSLALRYWLNDPNYRQSFSAQWNMDIQRAITNNLTVDVAYVGVHGYRETMWTDLNQPPLGAGWDTATVNACIANPSTACKPNVAAENGHAVQHYISIP